MSPISRRTFFAEAIATFSGLAIVGRSITAQTKVPIAIYKDPTCGCCHQWVRHMDANGFTPSVMDTRDMASVRKRYNVPAAIQSCHTAVVGNYVIEGHVPAADVKRLLTAKPRNVAGLAIPGMPASAPGMDLKPFQPYTVLSFDSKGTTTVFAKHDKG